MHTARFEPLESRQMMSVALNTNLVVNGDAETLPPPITQIPAPPLAPPPPGPRGVVGWRTVGEFEAVRYGDAGMPSPASPGPALRGSMLFGGGMSERGTGTADSSTAVQDIDISSIAADVDAGRIKFDFSAFLGGFGFERDSITATLVFNDGRVNPPPGPTLKGPTPAERKGVTGLVFRSVGGDVPMGTRTIRVVLEPTKVYGKYIDGFADNVELKLSSTMPMSQGIVRGRVMDDANVNGKLDRGEGPVAGALVYSDRDQNGRWDAGEPRTNTDANGAYALTTAAGLNHIRAVPPPGYRVTGAQVRKVMVNGGLTTSGHSFLATRNGVITGQVFVDWNGNGRFDKKDDDEPRQFVSVFLDSNNNGKLDKGEARTTTDAKGNFSFVVATGTYTVRQRENVTSFKQSLPGKGKGIIVKLAAGAVSKGNVFGLQPIPQ
jgi:hypothetical protein